MIEIILMLVLVSVIALIFFVGVASGRDRQRREELEEWEGILDVKRETKDKLNTDSEYAERVQDHFNDK